jgi:hypothetical protein
VRHSHASLLLEKGVDIATVSERLGHSSVATTAAIYSHAIRGKDRAAAQVWDDIMQQSRAEKSTDQARKADSTHKSETATKTQAAKGAPTAVPTRPVTATSSIPPSGVIDHAGADVPRTAPPFTPTCIGWRRSTSWRTRCPGG